MPLILRACQLAGLAMPDAATLPLAVAQQEAVSVLYLHRPAAAVPEAAGNSDDRELSAMLHTALLRLSLFYFWNVADLERGRWAASHAFNLTHRLRAVAGADPTSNARNFAKILSLFAFRQFNPRLGTRGVSEGSRLHARKLIQFFFHIHPPFSHPHAPPQARWRRRLSRPTAWTPAHATPHSSSPRWAPRT